MLAAFHLGMARFPVSDPDALLLFRFARHPASLGASWGGGRNNARSPALNAQQGRFYRVFRWFFASGHVASLSDPWPLDIALACSLG
jgi:hypothetical protein